MTFRDRCRSRAIALIALPPAYSRRIRKTVSKTYIPISPPENPGSCLNHRNEGSLLDADHPANGVPFARRSTGSVGKLDVERAGAATATARAAIPALEGQQQVALFELAALLGTTPDQVPESARRCTTPPEPKASIPVGDGAALLRRRPDLRQAERQLAADTARIGVATADLYPRISLGGSGNFFRNDQVRGANSFSFSLGPLISWSFPNIAVARTRIRQAQAQGEASLAAFDGRLITALKEVEQALTVVTTEQRSLDALGEAQARAEKAYEFADLRYRAGSVAYLDVLVAQSEMLNARSSYAGSIQRLSSARVDLFKALGGGWQGIQSAQGPVQEPAGSGDASAATEQDSLPFRDATKALRH